MISLLLRQSETGQHASIVRALSVCVLLCLVACAGPQQQARTDAATGSPRLLEDAVLMEDGYHLPLRRWDPAGTPRAIVLALHGFNDYSNAFDSTARYLTQRAFAIYAIDQRGFGRSQQVGLWGGEIRMQDDLVNTATLLCARYPDTPLYLMGESMGGAVILSAAEKLHRTCATAAILSAPAVWGWQSMPWWQGMVLRMATQIVPGMKVTGEGLDIRPSDNIEMLRALGRDPLVIKETRIDTIYGLTDLMQSAHDQGRQLRLPTLLLYGEHDEIITPLPLCRMLGTLGDFPATGWRMLLYPDGFHMLTRDLQAEVVLGDVAAWLSDRSARLPSGQEVARDAPRLQKLCE